MIFLNFFRNHQTGRVFIIVGLVLLLIIAAAGNSQAVELKKIVPNEKDLDSLKMNEKPDFYDPDNLYEYINGAAPAYLAYGFARVVTFAITNPVTKTDIIVDVYDMGDSLNAFGIYATERAPEGSAEDFGGGSFQSDYGLYFWQDRYYVKLMAYEATPEIQKSLTRLAQILSQRIPKQGTRPHLFSFFPEHEQINRTEHYIKTDVLGQNYFSNGYSIKYSRDDKEYQVFLIHGDNAEQAKLSFASYVNFIRSSGTITTGDLKIGDQAFAGSDRYYGPVVFAQKGRYIVGVLGLDDEKAARELVAGMIGQL